MMKCTRRALDRDHASNIDRDIPACAPQIQHGHDRVSRDALRLKERIGLQLRRKARQESARVNSEIESQFLIVLVDLDDCGGLAQEQQGITIGLARESLPGQ